MLFTEAVIFKLTRFAFGDYGRRPITLDPPYAVMGAYLKGIPINCVTAPDIVASSLKASFRLDIIIYKCGSLVMSFEEIFYADLRAANLLLDWLYMKGLMFFSSSPIVFIILEYD